MNLQDRYTTNCSSSPKSYLTNSLFDHLLLSQQGNIKSQFQGGSRHPINILFFDCLIHDANHSLFKQKTVVFGVTDSASPLHLNSLLDLGTQKEGGYLQQHSG